MMIKSITTEVKHSSEVRSKERTQCFLMIEQQLSLTNTKGQDHISSMSLMIYVEEQKYRAGKNFIRKINQHLKKVAVELRHLDRYLLYLVKAQLCHRMKKKKVSPYIIQEAFGHKDIKTTENYMSSLWRMT